MLEMILNPNILQLFFLVYIEKHVICLKDYRIRSFLSIRHAHGDLCKHLGIDSSTDLDEFRLGIG